jgi:hypothetical protein
VENYFVCHCERPEGAWQSDQKGRCEGEARGNLKEIPRFARNDTSCQIASALPRNDSLYCCILGR